MMPYLFLREAEQSTNGMYSAAFQAVRKGFGLNKEC